MNACPPTPLSPTDPPFESLSLWVDPVPRSGALNMAIDEALLRNPPPTAAGLPLLRWYDWREPALSLGYFQRLAEVRAAFPGPIEWTRRWTGGGIVDHRNDRTYSLIVPRSAAFARQSPSETYCQLHRCLAACLGGLGLPATLATEDAGSDGGSGACFQGGTVAADVVVEGRKIAGAAQRRTREGLLHQGSIRLPDEGLAEALTSTFGRFLATTVSEIEIPGDWMAEAEALSRERYGTREWLERR